MLIGVLKEIKSNEFRIGLVPSSVREFTSRDHQVIVERDAAMGIGSTDDDYRAAGAQVVDSAEELFARAEMIVKVKEPQARECAIGWTETSPEALISSSSESENSALSS